MRTWLAAFLLLIAATAMAADQTVRLGDSWAKVDTGTGEITLGHLLLGDYLQDGVKGRAIGSPVLAEMPDKASIAVSVNGFHKTVSITNGGKLITYTYDGPQTNLTHTVKLRENGLLCRLDGQKDPIVRTQLGTPTTVPCADAIFLPKADCAIRFPGTTTVATTADGKRFDITPNGVYFDVIVTPNYIKQTLKTPFYVPLDWSKFSPTVPCGWVTWYGYYQSITDAETIKNAEWLAANLKAYGVEYIQIDDCWQGRGNGGGDNRDWDTISPLFPSGMKPVADRIKALGFKAGIWLIPQTQSSETLYNANKDMFVHTPDGKAFEGGWPGRYLIDTTTKKGLAYIDAVFDRLDKAGFEHYKIDGQPTIAEFYRNNNATLSKPSADVNNNEAYRASLKTIRDRIGPDRFILGCYGTALEGIGYMDGARTGQDVGEAWGGFFTALDATQNGLFLNNIAWHSDPDVLSICEPLTLDQARAWATMYGLTGQQVFLSDCTYQYPPDRIDVAKKVMPPLRIMPVDMYRYATSPDVFALYNAGGPVVVGVFNFEGTPTAKKLDLATLCPDMMAKGGCVAYDFWNDKFIGTIGSGDYAVALPATSCRALVVQPKPSHPIMLATRRHISQAPRFATSGKWDADKMILSGDCEIIAGDPHELVIYAPRIDDKTIYVAQSWTAKSAAVTGTYAAPILRLSLTSPKTGKASWQVQFKAEPTPESPLPPPMNLAVKAVTYRLVSLTWNPVPGCEGYRLVRTATGGKPSGDIIVDGTSYTDVDIKPEAIYGYSVAGSSGDGALHTAAEISVTIPTVPPPPPLPDVYLGDLKPAFLKQGYDGVLRIDKSITDVPLSIHGKSFARGLGSHAPATIVYDVPANAKRLVAYVGIDGAREKSAAASVIFRVLIDDVLAFDSGIMRGSMDAEPIDIKIEGAKKITLVMDDAANGNGDDHADWAEAGFVTTAK